MTRLVEIWDDVERHKALAQTTGTRGRHDLPAAGEDEAPKEWAGCSYSKRRGEYS